MHEDALRIATRNSIEILTPEELKEALSSGAKLKGYIGFEPSGMFHIGWIIWARKLQDLMDVGVKMILLEATWHAWINDKLGGVMERIRACARYVEHCLRALGVDMDRVEVVDAEELVSDKDYWALVLRVAKSVSLARVKRALTIMGRTEPEAVMDFSKLIYPAMQVADMFYLGVDIALGGMDQRRAHVLARETAPKLGFKKPMAIHTPLLSGLIGGGRMEAGLTGEEALIARKMSKSKPETAIFIHDSPEEIRRKIRKAFCPPRQAEGNPILEINKYILFQGDDFTLVIDRPPRYGGRLEVSSYDELEKLYIKGSVHPLDLKNATAEALIRLLEPVRRYFETVPEARRLLEEMRRAEITR